MMEELRMNDCHHNFQVWSPIDTVEVCTKCGARQQCESLFKANKEAISNDVHDSDQRANDQGMP